MVTGEHVVSRTVFRGITIAIAAALGLSAAGCRDGSLGGSAIAEHHIIAGRAPASGGPGLTDIERQQGWFATETADLSEFESHLRSTLGMRVNVLVDEGAGKLPGTAEFFTADTVLLPDPADYRSDPRPAVATLAAPFYTTDTDGSFLGQWVRYSAPGGAY